jgi:hypothetical protein
VSHDAGVFPVGRDPMVGHQYDRTITIQVELLGGGDTFQSDHSVTASVSGRTCEAIVHLVREFGRDPTRLGEFDGAT